MLIRQNQLYFNPPKGKTMINKNYLRKVESHIKIYKNNLFYIDKTLKKYCAEDALYFLSQSHTLQKNLKTLEELLICLKNENAIFKLQFQKNFIKFFEELQLEIRDFFIMLKWNNFGELRTELKNMCREKTSLSRTDKKNYRNLLGILNAEI